MCGALGRAGLLLVLTTVAVLASGGTASAESMRWRDRDWTTATPAAPWNIKFAAVANRQERLKFRVRLERVTRGKSKVLIRATMAEAPRWSIEAKARWPKAAEQRDRLFLTLPDADREPLRCHGMESRWETGRNGQVVIRIPHSCLSGPDVWHNFRVGTLRGADGGLEDRTRGGEEMQPEL